jgi:hypothetical protein
MDGEVGRWEKFQKQKRKGKNEYVLYGDEPRLHTNQNFGVICFASWSYPQMSQQLRAGPVPRDFK